MEDQHISEVITTAIKIMRNCFGGTDVELISKYMFRDEPHEHCPLGHLGVNVEINGHITFLSCEDAENILVYGIIVADDIVYNVIKDHEY